MSNHSRLAMRRRLAPVVALVFSACVALASASHAEAFSLTTPPPKAPFRQCPPVGADHSCGFLVWISPVGVPRILIDPSQPTYDGADDTLVGVQNDSSFALTSIKLVSPLDIYGFDSDGPCTFAGVLGCPFGTTGYEGPYVAFGVTSGKEGRVKFNPGIQPGKKTWFGLEDRLTANQNIAVEQLTGTGVYGQFVEATLPLPGSSGSLRISRDTRVFLTLAGDLLEHVLPPQAAIALAVVKAVPRLNDERNAMDAACVPGASRAGCQAAEAQLYADLVNVASGIAIDALPPGLRDLAKYKVDALGIANASRDAQQAAQGQ